MDITTLELEDVGRYEIRKPGGGGTGIFFLLAGPAHPKRVAYEDKASKRFIKSYNKQGRNSLPEDPEELFDRGTDRLVALTLGWEGVTDKGQVVPFSAEAVRGYYENRKLTVRKQITEALDDDEVFTVSSSTD